MLISFLLIKPLKTCPKVGRREVDGESFGLQRHYAFDLVVEESKMCLVLVWRVLLPPGGKAGDNQPQERQMAPAASAPKNTLSIHHQGNSKEVRAPMGFHHHRANRISRRKEKNDALCKSGASIVMSNNKQKAVIVTAWNICVTGLTDLKCLDWRLF